LTDAESLFKRMLDANPRSAMALTGLAHVGFKRALITRDTFDEPGLRRALAFADRALASDPTLADGYVAKGWIVRDLKDRGGARATVEQARRLAPLSGRALALDATLAMDDGETERAEQLYTEALARPMTRFLANTVFVYLRELYWAMGDIDAVDQCDRRSIDLQAESAWAKGNYATLLLEKGDADAAIAMAQSALSQIGYGVARETPSDAYCAKGHLWLWDDKNPANAKRSFENAVRVLPTSACGAYGLGATHQYLGRQGGNPSELGEARRAYESAGAMAPNDPLPAKALAALE
jgi:tetratricopeptide (TPR) repeat protein